MTRFFASPIQSQTKLAKLWARFFSEPSGTPSILPPLSDQSSSSTNDGLIKGDSKASSTKNSEKRWPPLRVVSAEPAGNLSDSGIYRLANQHQTHRSRLLVMKLSHSGLCSNKRCEMLASVGVDSIGDLLVADLMQIASKFKARKRAFEDLHRYRRACSMAIRIPGLMPADALLLVYIHRYDLNSLIGESCAQLTQDLRRLLDSSLGQKLIRGRRPPSQRKVKRWIEAANQLQAA